MPIGPDNCFVGGGVYNPQPEQLKKNRQEIDYCFEEWKALINTEIFKKTFPCGIQNLGVLGRVTKEFERANPVAEFLKMKGFYTSEKLSNKEMQSKDTFAKIITHFKHTKPLIDFLNRAIEHD